MNLYEDYENTELTKTGWRVGYIRNSAVYIGAYPYESFMSDGGENVSLAAHS